MRAVVENAGARLGMAVVGFGMSSGAETASVARAAERAERCGYESFWLNHDSQESVELSALAAAAAATERIRLGVGVVPVSAGVDALADALGSLDIAPARLTVGLGAGDSGSLADLREGIAVFRSRRCERVAVGALGPRALRLAGEAADEVLLNWLAPDHARRSREIVAGSAAGAGRATPRVAAYVRVAVGADRDERARRTAELYSGYAAYRRHFARQGVDPATLVVRVADGAALAAALSDWHGVVDEIIVRPIE